MRQCCGKYLRIRENAPRGKRKHRAENKSFVSKTKTLVSKTKTSLSKKKMVSKTNHLFQPNKIIWIIYTFSNHTTITLFHDHKVMTLSHILICIITQITHPHSHIVTQSHRYTFKHKRTHTYTHSHIHSHIYIRT